MPSQEPPFSPTQRVLIQIAATAMILWALWCVAKALHPRWRKGVFESYFRVGTGLFSLAVGLELFLITNEWHFFTENPKRILILPGTLAVYAVLFVLPNAIVEGRRKRGMPTAPERWAARASDAGVVRIARAYLVFLAIILPLMPVSLYGQLFGPTWMALFGIAGFVSAIALFFSSRSAMGKKFLQICPGGLSERYQKLRLLEAPLLRAAKVAGAIAAIGLVTLAASARLDGVPGTPVFVQREHYVFNNHGAHTEVSRLRYCCAGAGFHVGWHGGAVVAVLSAIYALIFARVPDLKKEESK